MQKSTSINCCTAVHDDGVDIYICLVHREWKSIGILYHYVTVAYSAPSLESICMYNKYESVQCYYGVDGCTYTPLLRLNVASLFMHRHVFVGRLTIF